MSESDITLDYDDDDWKAPDKPPSTDTGENNNIPVNVDHEEVIEPQNTDSTTDQNESGKNGKTKAMQKRKRTSEENYTGVC